MLQGVNNERKRTMIVLGKEEIEKLTDRNEMMDAMEEAFRIFGKGECYMPPRTSVKDGNKELMYMPCYTKESIGTKILSIFPDNAKLGLPSIDGVVLLNNAETGAPEAILDGQAVTAWRTGAVGGVGIRHFSREDASTYGVIGAGTQAFYQTLFACAARKIRQVFLYNHSDRDLTEFMEKLKKAIADPSVEVVQCKTAEEVVKNSDIICTATPSATPVLPNDASILRGKCIIAIGSYTPQMREIPDAVWDLTDQVFIELPYACEESGDLSQPIAEGRLKQENAILMSSYLEYPEERKEKLRKEINEAGKTTYFKSVGMGLFDICAAKKLLDKAKER